MALSTQPQEAELLLKTEGSELSPGGGGWEWRGTEIQAPAVTKELVSWSPLQDPEGASREIHGGLTINSKEKTQKHKMERLRTSLVHFTFASQLHGSDLAHRFQKLKKHTFYM